MGITKQKSNEGEAMSKTKMDLLEDVISTISVFYREKLKETNAVHNEFLSTEDCLREKGEEISLGEYKRLTEKKERLEEEAKFRHVYSNAIHDVRELLFNYCSAAKGN